MTRRRSSPLGLELVLSVVLALVMLPLLSHGAPVQESHDIQKYSEGCYYNYNHYSEGDRILTNEPCLNCTCHNKMLMCYLRVCPFTKPIGHDCTIEKREDQCCPIVTCPEVPVDIAHHSNQLTTHAPGTELSIPEKYGCSIDNKFYAEGAQVPSNPHKPCELCYCIRNRTACLMQECTLHIDGCQPIYNKGSCCPVRYNCDHENELLEIEDFSTTTTTVRPTPGYVLPSTTSPAITTDCVHNNEVYADGASITGKNACEHCYCMRGDIVCAVQECEMPTLESGAKMCRALPPAAGECCPSNYICDDDSVTTEATLTTITPLVQGNLHESVSQEDVQLQEHIDDKVAITDAPEKKFDAVDEDLNKIGLETTITPVAEEEDSFQVTTTSTIKESGQEATHSPIEQSSTYKTEEASEGTQKDKEETSTKTPTEEEAQTGPKEPAVYGGDDETVQIKDEDKLTTPAIASEDEIKHDSPITAKPIEDEKPESSTETKPVSDIDEAYTDGIPATSPSIITTPTKPGDSPIKETSSESAEFSDETPVHLPEIEDKIDLDISESPHDKATSSPIYEMVTEVEDSNVGLPDIADHKTEAPLAEKKPEDESVTSTGASVATTDKKDDEEEPKKPVDITTIRAETYEEDAGTTLAPGQETPSKPESEEEDSSESHGLEHVSTSKPLPAEDESGHVTEPSREEGDTSNQTTDRSGAEEEDKYHSTEPSFMYEHKKEKDEVTSRPVRIHLSEEGESTTLPSDSKHPIDEEQSTAKYPELTTDRLDVQSADSSTVSPSDIDLKKPSAEEEMKEEIEMNTSDEITSSPISSDSTPKEKESENDNPESEMFDSTTKLSESGIQETTTHPLKTSEKEHGTTISTLTEDEVKEEEAITQSASVDKDVKPIDEEINQEIPEAVSPTVRPHLDESDVQSTDKIVDEEGEQEQEKTTLSPYHDDIKKPSAEEGTKTEKPEQNIEDEQPHLMESSTLSSYPESTGKPSTEDETVKEQQEQITEESESSKPSDDQSVEQIGTTIKPYDEEYEKPSAQEESGEPDLEKPSDGQYIPQITTTIKQHVEEGEKQSVEEKPEKSEIEKPSDEQNVPQITTTIKPYIEEGDKQSAEEEPKESETEKPSDEQYLTQISTTIKPHVEEGEKQSVEEELEDSKTEKPSDENNVPQLNTTVKPLVEEGVTPFAEDELEEFETEKPSDEQNVPQINTTIEPHVEEDEKPSAEVESEEFETNKPVIDQGTPQVYTTINPNLKETDKPSGGLPESNVSVPLESEEGTTDKITTEEEAPKERPEQENIDSTTAYPSGELSPQTTKGQDMEKDEQEVDDLTTGQPSAEKPEEPKVEEDEDKAKPDSTTVSPSKEEKDREPEQGITDSTTLSSALPELENSDSQVTEQSEQDKKDSTTPSSFYSEDRKETDQTTVSTSVDDKVLEADGIKDKPAEEIIPSDASTAKIPSEKEEIKPHTDMGTSDSTTSVPHLSDSKPKDEESLPQPEQNLPEDNKTEDEITSSSTVPSEIVNVGVTSSSAPGGPVLGEEEDKKKPEKESFASSVESTTSSSEEDELKEHPKQEMTTLSPSSSDSFTENDEEVVKGKPDEGVEHQEADKIPSGDVSLDDSTTIIPSIIEGDMITQQSLGGITDTSTTTPETLAHETATAESEIFKKQEEQGFVDSSTATFEDSNENVTKEKTELEAGPSSTLAPGLYGNEQKAEEDESHTTATAIITPEKELPGKTEGDQYHEIIPSAIPGEGDCLENGMTYKNNTMVPKSEECQENCICRNSIVICSQVECYLPPDLKNCILDETSTKRCCPQYICGIDNFDEGQRTTTPEGLDKEIQFTTLTSGPDSTSDDKEVSSTSSSMYGEHPASITEIPTLSIVEDKTQVPTKLIDEQESSTTKLPSGDEQIDLLSGSTAKPADSESPVDEFGIPSKKPLSDEESVTTKDNKDEDNLLTTVAPSSEETTDSTTESSKPIDEHTTEKHVHHEETIQHFSTSTSKPLQNETEASTSNDSEGIDSSEGPASEEGSNETEEESEEDTKSPIVIDSSESTTISPLVSKPSTSGIVQEPTSIDSESAQTSTIIPELDYQKPEMPEDLSHTKIESDQSTEMPLSNELEEGDRTTEKLHVPTSSTKPVSTILTRVEEPKDDKKESGAGILDKKDEIAQTETSTPHIPVILDQSTEHIKTVDEKPFSSTVSPIQTIEPLDTSTEMEAEHVMGETTAPSVVSGEHTSAESTEDVSPTVSSTIEKKPTEILGSTGTEDVSPAVSQTSEKEPSEVSGSTEPVDEADEKEDHTISSVVSPVAVTLAPTSEQEVSENLGIQTLRPVEGEDNLMEGSGAEIEEENEDGIEQSTAPSKKPTIGVTEGTVPQKETSEGTEEVSYQTSAPTVDEHLIEGSGSQVPKDERKPILVTIIPDDSEDKKEETYTTSPVKPTEEFDDEEEKKKVPTQTISPSIESQSSTESAEEIVQQTDGPTATDESSLSTIRPQAVETSDEEMESQTSALPASEGDKLDSQGAVSQTTISPAFEDESVVSKTEKPAIEDKQPVTSRTEDSDQFDETNATTVRSAMKEETGSASEVPEVPSLTGDVTETPDKKIESPVEGSEMHDADLTTISTKYSEKESSSAVPTLATPVEKEKEDDSTTESPFKEEAGSENVEPTTVLTTIEEDESTSTKAPSRPDHASETEGAKPDLPSETSTTVPISDEKEHTEKTVIQTERPFHVEEDASTEKEIDQTVTELSSTQTSKPLTDEIETSTKTEKPVSSTDASVTPEIVAILEATHEPGHPESDDQVLIDEKEDIPLQTESPVDEKIPVAEGENVPIQTENPIDEKISTTDSDKPSSEPSHETDKITEKPQAPLSGEVPVGTDQDASSTKKPSIQTSTSPESLDETQTQKPESEAPDYTEHPVKSEDTSSTPVSIDHQDTKTEKQATLEESTSPVSVDQQVVKITTVKPSEDASSAESEESESAEDAEFDKTTMTSVDAAKPSATSIAPVSEINVSTDKHDEEVGQLEGSTTKPAVQDILKEQITEKPTESHFDESSSAPEEGVEEEKEKPAVPATTEKIATQEPEKLSPVTTEIPAEITEAHKTEDYSTSGTIPAATSEQPDVAIENKFDSELPKPIESEDANGEAEVPLPTTAHPLFPHIGIETTSSLPQLNASDRIDTDGQFPESTQGPFKTSSSTHSPTTVQPTTSQSITNPPTSHYQPPGYGQVPPQYPSYAEDEYTDEDETEVFGPGTCRYGGKLFVSAQQIPRDDPCDFCFCFRSDIICLQQSCPPPITGCHEEPISGFCCPRYECPVSMATTLNITTSTTTTSTTLPPHFLHHAYRGAAAKNGCHISGKSYKVGDKIDSASGPCMHCTCGGDGQMKCDPKTCTPEPMLRQMIAVVASRRR